MAVAYFDLLDDLRALLGVEVDLVMAGAVKNRYIARDIERTRQLLYAACTRRLSADIVDACDAIAAALAGVEFDELPCGV